MGICGKIFLKIFKLSLDMAVCVCIYIIMKGCEK